MYVVFISKWSDSKVRELTAVEVQNITVIAFRVLPSQSYALMRAVLKDIPQNQFQNCFEGWTSRWRLCIASHGEYFEVIFNSEVCSTFTAMNSRNLLSDHVYP
jgi:hypothetical protein